MGLTGAQAECPAASADVSWVRLAGAESCPGAAAIRGEVARRIGQAIGSPGDGKIVEAVVQGSPGRWSVRIATSGCGTDPAVREIESDAPTCEPISSAAVLVIALAIDPGAALAPPAPPASSAAPAAAPAASSAAPAPAPAASDSTPPAPPPTASPGPPQRPPATRPRPPAGARAAPSVPAPSVETRFTLRGLATFGLLPAAAPGIAWSSEWRIPPWLVLSTGVFYLPEQPAEDPTFAFGMTAGWAGLCADFLRVWRITIAPCARLLGGAIHAVVRTHPTIVGTDPGQRAWAGASLGARAAARIAGPVQVELGSDVIAPITRHEFGLRDDPEPIFLQPPVTLALFAGIGVAFP